MALYRKTSLPPLEEEASELPQAPAPTELVTLEKAVQSLDGNSRVRPEDVLKQLNGIVHLIKSRLLGSLDASVKNQLMIRVVDKAYIQLLHCITEVRAAAYRVIRTACTSSVVAEHIYTKSNLQLFMIMSIEQIDSNYKEKRQCFELFKVCTSQAVALLKPGLLNALMLLLDCPEDPLHYLVVDYFTVHFQAVPTSNRALQVILQKIIQKSIATNTYNNFSTIFTKLLLWTKKPAVDLISTYDLNVLVKLCCDKVFLEDVQQTEKTIPSDLVVLSQYHIKQFSLVHLGALQLLNDTNLVNLCFQLKGLSVEMGFHTIGMMLNIFSLRMHGHLFSETYREFLKKVTNYTSEDFQKQQLLKTLGGPAKSAAGKVFQPIFEQHRAESDSFLAANNCVFLLNYQIGSEIKVYKKNHIASIKKHALADQYMESKCSMYSTLSSIIDDKGDFYYKYDCETFDVYLNADKQFLIQHGIDSKLESKYSQLNLLALSELKLFAMFFGSNKNQPWQPVNKTLQLQSRNHIYDVFYKELLKLKKKCLSSKPARKVYRPPSTPPSAFNFPLFVKLYSSKFKYNSSPLYILHQTFQKNLQDATLYRNSTLQTLESYVNQSKVTGEPSGSLWDFNCACIILSMCYKNEDDTFLKFLIETGFIHRLLLYFKPSETQFRFEQKTPSNEIKVLVCILVLDLLLQYESGYLEILHSNIFTKIFEHLAKTLILKPGDKHLQLQKVAANFIGSQKMPLLRELTCFLPDKLNNSMSFFYCYFVGYLSFRDLGTKMLLELGFIDLLSIMVTLPEHVDLTVQFLLCFDYENNTIARILFEKFLLAQKSINAKYTALDILKMLYSFSEDLQRKPDFINWLFEMLKLLIYDGDLNISMSALETFLVYSNLLAVSKVQIPFLLHIDRLGKLIMLHLINAFPSMGSYLSDIVYLSALDHLHNSDLEEMQDNLSDLYSTNQDVLNQAWSIRNEQNLRSVNLSEKSMQIEFEIYSQVLSKQYKDRSKNEHHQHLSISFTHTHDMRETKLACSKLLARMFYKKTSLQLLYKNILKPPLCLLTEVLTYQSKTDKVSLNAQGTINKLQSQVAELGVQSSKSVGLIYLTANILSIQHISFASDTVDRICAKLYLLLRHGNHVYGHAVFVAVNTIATNSNLHSSLAKARFSVLYYGSEPVVVPADLSTLQKYGELMEVPNKNLHRKFNQVLKKEQVLKGLHADLSMPPSSFFSKLLAEIFKLTCDLSSAKKKAFAKFMAEYEKVAFDERFFKALHEVLFPHYNLSLEVRRAVTEVFEDRVTWTTGSLDLLDPIHDEVPEGDAYFGQYARICRELFNLTI